MNINYTSILNSVNQLFTSGNYYYSDYVYAQLKTNEILEFINEIINKSNKTPSEAIFVLLAAIRYIKKDTNTLNQFKDNNSFKNYIFDNYDKLLDLAINKKVQGNALERGLPIADVISKKTSGNPICIIELGASYGLIGTMLLNSKSILSNKNVYFQQNQKIPENSYNLKYYLGIDIDPPDKDWLIACYSNPEDAVHIMSYIDKIENNNLFKLIKASAIGFSKLTDVQELANKEFDIILLNSFMLYQFNESEKRQLTDEIRSFCKNFNGHWISQEVYLNNNEEKHDYYIEWDGSRVVELEDDKCRDWKWM